MKNKTISDAEKFISFAAHDLRAPMRQVAFLSELLRKEVMSGSGRQMELIDMLKEVSRGANDLISDVLSCARTNVERRPDETFELSKLCSEIFFILDPLNSHQLHVAPRWVHAEKVAVQIILRNLFDNAIKHGGHDKVEVSVEASDGAPATISIEVRDNGVGFDHSSVALLDHGDLVSGHGFGLLGIRRLLSDRGGTINARKHSSGIGSVISISMPGCLRMPAPLTG